MWRALIVFCVVAGCVAQSIASSASPHVLEIKATEHPKNPRISPQIRFDVPMDRQSVSAAINYFPGAFDPNQSYQSLLPLDLYCSSEGWAVKNPNAVPVSFTWKSKPTNEEGIGVALAGKTFQIKSVEKSETMQIYVRQNLLVEKFFSQGCDGGVYPGILDMTLSWFPTGQALSVRPRFFQNVKMPYTISVSSGAKSVNGQTVDRPAWLTFTPQALGATWKMLGPKGILIGPDDVTVSLFNNEFKAPIRVFFQEIDPYVVTANTSKFQPLGIYYRIGSPDAPAWEPNTEILISLKLPDRTNSSEVILQYLAIQVSLPIHPHHLFIFGIICKQNPTQNKIDSLALYTQR